MESLHNPLHSTNLRNLHLQSLHNPFHFTIHCTSQSQFTIHNHTSQFTITRGLCGEKRPLRSVSHTLLGAFAQVVDLSESLDPVLNERRWAASGDLDKRRPRPRKLASPDERRWTTSGADVERRPRPRKLASDKRRWASLGATSEDLDERCPKSRKLASRNCRRCLYVTPPPEGTLGVTSPPQPAPRQCCTPPPRAGRGPRSACGGW